jgi:hypothetical protein
MNSRELSWTAANSINTLNSHFLNLGSEVQGLSGTQILLAAIYGERHGASGPSFRQDRAREGGDG